MKDQKMLSLVIIWSVIAAIWIGLTISGIIQKDEVWMIAIRAFVAVLSLADAVIWFVKYRKSSKNNTEK